jgi:hypothetical protein
MSEIDSCAWYLPQGNLQEQKRLSCGKKQGVRAKPGPTIEEQLPTAFSTEGLALGRGGVRIAGRGEAQAMNLA